MKTIHQIMKISTLVALLASCVTINATWAATTNNPPNNQATNINDGTTQTQYNTSTDPYATTTQTPNSIDPNATPDNYLSNPTATQPNDGGIQNAASSPTLTQTPPNTSPQATTIESVQNQSLMRQNNLNRDVNTSNNTELTQPRAERERVRVHRHNYDYQTGYRDNLDGSYGTNYTTVTTPHRHHRVHRNYNYDNNYYYSDGGYGYGGGGCGCSW